MRGALCLLALALSAITAAQAPVDYVSPGGEFRISLPGPPSVDERADATVYRLADGDITYLIRQMPIPAAYAGDPTPERLFDEFQSSGVAALQGALVSHRPVAAAGHAQPGREFVVHAQTKRTGQPYEMTTRLFCVGPDLLVFSSTTPRTEGARARAFGVLDSITLLK